MEMNQILCFGDSNTYGYIPGGRGRYPWEVRWTGRLEEKLHGKGFRIAEEGLCGRTTVFADELREGRRGIDLLPAILETHQPLRGVILMLGTNDCKTVFGASAGVIAKGMEKLISQVRKADAAMPILVMSPILLGERVYEPEFDPEFSEHSVEVSKCLKAEYQKIARKCGCGFLAASDFADPSAEDQEHLNEAGHAALADAVYHKIKELGWLQIADGIPA